MQKQTITFRQFRKRNFCLSLGAALGSIALCGGIGALIDLALDKRPFFFIIGLILAFFITNLLAVYLSRKFAQKNQLKL